MAGFSEDNKGEAERADDAIDTRIEVPAISLLAKLDRSGIS